MRFSSQDSSKFHPKDLDTVVVTSLFTQRVECATPGTKSSAGSLERIKCLHTAVTTKKTLVEKRESKVPRSMYLLSLCWLVGSLCQ